MDGQALIVPTDRGLFCPAGDFFIDAWKPVARNVVTHAHSDHARTGSERYLAASEGAAAASMKYCSILHAGVKAMRRCAGEPVAEKV